MGPLGLGAKRPTILGVLSAIRKIVARPTVL